MKIILFAACVLLLSFVVIWRRRTNRQIFGLGNIAEGAHDKGWISRYPTTEIGTGQNSQRLYLFAINAEDEGCAAIAGINDVPIGVFGDSTERGTIEGVSFSDLSMPLVVRLLGSSGIGTQFITINSLVSKGDFLVPDAGGYARTLPATPGTYWVCGRALESGIAGDNIEFDPTLPYPVTVPA